jgi:hypothetical protein
MHRQTLPILASIAGLAGIVALGAPALAQDGFGEMPATSANWTTGPEVGDRIPEIAAPDQSGVRRTFDEIKGPNGALVFFFRSADW